MDIRTELALIPDPRIDRCKKHHLVDILLLCIIAMVCGVENVENIAFFGDAHEPWLKQYLTLPHGSLAVYYGGRPDQTPAFISEILDFGEY
jgi:hypothetical protein